MIERVPYVSVLSIRGLAGYGLALFLGILTYFYALDSDHIPKNGDEFVYLNIARLTAGTGHWLPLQASDEVMRNTKPPLLCWQGIASSNWGRIWTRWTLRYPSVVYTLLTGLLVFLLGRKLTGRRESGYVAFLVYLAFFSTYRYGRPYLTDPPVVFWLFVPLFVLLYWQPHASESGWLVPLGLGLAVGIGLLYKSFALLVPVALALAWWYFHRRSNRLGPFLRHDLLKLALLCVVALAVFALWFVLDPNPAAIWRNFILGENLTKFQSDGGGYLRNLVWGGSSIWRIVVGYPLNAGLLALPIAMLFWVGFTRRHQMTEAEKLLWVWVLVLFVFFSLPSQRDERYLLPGMPALAVLCALNLQHISRKAFLATLVVIGAGIGVLAYLSIRLQREMTDMPLYPVTYWLLLIGLGVLVVCALSRSAWTRVGTIVAALLVSLAFAAFMRPLDGPVGTYNTQTQRYLAGKQVWVPINFRAKEEGYRFFLPAADVRGYFDQGLNATNLSARYPIFVLPVPMQDAAPDGLKVIGQRWDVGSRHSSRQIMEMVRGRVFENLFRKEMVLESP